MRIWVHTFVWETERRTVDIDGLSYRASYTRYFSYEKGEQFFNYKGTWRVLYPLIPNQYKRFTTKTAPVNRQQILDEIARIRGGLD